MSKKEFLFPFLLIFSSVIFIIVVLGVFFTKGKSKKWNARKMRIVGFLLSLTVSPQKSMSNFKA